MKTPALHHWQHYVESRTNWRRRRVRPLSRSGGATPTGRKIATVLVAAELLVRPVMDIRDLRRQIWLATLWANRTAQAHGLDVALHRAPGDGDLPGDRARPARLAPCGQPDGLARLRLYRAVRRGRRLGPVVLADRALFVDAPGALRVVADRVRARGRRRLPERTHDALARHRGCHLHHRRRHQPEPIRWPARRADRTAHAGGAGSGVTTARVAGDLPRVSRA